MTNTQWSSQLLSRLAEVGVREVVFCAGARNSPLVVGLDHSEGFAKYSYFEERSAAFFALGRARMTGAPVAIVTTSGTAVAELLPATIEAFHTGVPLVLVTADRPRRLRGTGAPQAIDQTGLFGKFVEAEFDLELGDLPDLSEWKKRTAVHINVCLDEPLLDAKPTNQSMSFPLEENFRGKSEFKTSAGSEWASLRITKFMRSSGPLLVLVGSLETDEERRAVQSFISKTGAPAYVESTSGIRESAEISEQVLKSGDKLLPTALKKGWVRRVLRIGGVPTARVWRDLEEPASETEVLSLSTLPFAGLSRGELVCSEIASTLNACDSVKTEWSRELLEFDREATKKLDTILQEEPESEPALFRRLSQLIPRNDLVYVGNSLPIREWDLAASFENPRAVEANRGVNGIDGQLSTFYGLAHGNKNGWAIVGDLTALYDLTAPWALQYLRQIETRIVVVNNSGGKIFHRIFKRESFENRHQLDFSGFAQQWKLPYRLSRGLPGDLNIDGDHGILEIVPDNAATDRFYDRYDKIFSEA